MTAPQFRTTGEATDNMTPGIPVGRVAVTIHRGPYDSLSESYQQIERWMRDQGLSAAGAPWETYLTDPGERPDPATWETEIVQPVR